MNIILNKIGEIRLTPARFFGFWAILFRDAPYSRPVLRVLGNTLCPRVHSLVMH